jgi:hypothetical protein
MDEIEIVTGFVLRSKRERYAGFLGSAKGRRKFIDSLYHFNDFDPDVVVEVSSGSATREGVRKELQRRGAGPSCYIISTNANLDRTTSRLSDAVNQVFAVVEGTTISCVPGRLAYYEGEPPKNRFILHRRGR